MLPETAACALAVVKYRLVEPSPRLSVDLLPKSVSKFDDLYVVTDSTPVPLLYDRSPLTEIRPRTSASVRSVNDRTPVVAL